MEKGAKTSVIVLYGLGRFDVDSHNDCKKLKNNMTKGKNKFLQSSSYCIFY